MQKKNYLIIILICSIIISVNYFTDFMFMTNNQTFIFIWIYLNTVVFPIWFAFYIYRIAKLNNQKSLISNGIIAIISYLLTYIIPSIEYINFETLTLNGDGESNAILKDIMFLGLFLISFLLIIFHLKIKKNSR